MGKFKKIINWILILAIIAFLYTVPLPVMAAGLPHYEYSRAKYELYSKSNEEYYNFLCSDAALADELPLLPNSTQHVPPTNDGNFPLNYKIWLDFGLIVYGKPENLPNNSFHCGHEIHHTGDEQPTPYYGDGYFVVDSTKTPCVEHGTNCPSKSGSHVRGEYRYLGFTKNNTPFEDIRYIMEHLTPFYGRMWIKEPWAKENQSRTNLLQISDYNWAVYSMPEESTAVRQWIDKTLSGWSPSGKPEVPFVSRYSDIYNLDAVRYDPEVYKYLNIDSPPTIMKSGQGTMYHQRPSLVYPKSLSVPVLTTKKQSPVECDITSNPYPNKVLESDLDKIVTLKVYVKGILHDENVFSGEDEDVLKTIYYNRTDIKSWNFKITLFGQTYTGTMPLNGTNQQVKDFTVSLTNRQLKDGFNIDAWVQPVFQNGKNGLYDTDSLYTKTGPMSIPTADNSIKIEIPTLEIGNDISEVAFDNIPFTGATDNTDMSLVIGKEVYVGGEPVSYDTFFSGRYIFPRTTDRNGYLTTVEVVYHLDKNAIIAEGVTPEVRQKIENTATLDFKSVDVVYVYPTKPYAHFSLSSNTWKENRIINVANDSPTSNIQIVMDHFPITQYRWYYGGDTTKLHYGTDTDLQKQLQYSKAGQYSITLEAMNSLGQWSDPYTCEFAVLEDYAPNIECNLSDSVVTRKDGLSAWHYGITSTDGDRITSARIELWYDSNNDGIVDAKLQQWDGLGDNSTCEKDDFPIYTPDKLGYYMYKIYANEEFVGVPGQDTLTQFVSSEDKKTAYYEVEWWVDNYQPLSDIYINAPIERPKVDFFIMLDKDLDDTKRETIFSERVNFENYLLGQNIIPNVSIWDMKTYTYSQPASTNQNTGASYPAATITYTSNGYSGTLSTTSVSDNGGYQDFGHWSNKTESQYFSGSHTNNSGASYTRSKKTDPWTQVASYNNPAPDSLYINSNGYSGSIPRTETITNYWNESVSSDGLSKTVTASHTANYGGTLYKTVSVWESDLRWVSNYTGTYSGTIYKNVRQPYTDPYQGESNKYILYLSDTTINELPDLNTALSKTDAELILAGQSGIKTQAQYDLYIDVTGKTAIQAVQEALEYIAESCPDIEQYYVLPGQTFNLNLAQYDLEGDNIIDSDLQYVHEKDFFDNPTGQEPNTLTAFDPDEGWTDTVLDKFMNVGKYRIFRRVKDLPEGENGSTYSYYSGATEVDIFVHRKPIADAQLDWRYNSSTGECETIWLDKSYDLDHASLPDKGITERKIMFRRNGGEWQYFIPDSLIYGTYDVQYFVKDMEGVWSDPWVKNFTLDGNPQMSAQARAKDPVFTLTSIPASETIEAYNIWTRQPSPVKLELALTPTVSGLPLAKSVVYQAGVTGTQVGQDIHWADQELQVPDVFPDGPRTFAVLARDLNSGFTTQIPFSVNIYTPINIVPGISGSSITCNQMTTITATTTKYPSTTTVQMQYGTPYQSPVMNMVGTVSGNAKGWTVSYTIPNAVSDGIYTARFVSTNPSGKQEIKTCTYTVTHNRPPAVTITGTNPSYIYEGDDVSINFSASDPDLQPLNYEIRFSPGIAGVWTGVVNPSGGVYPPMSIPTAQNIHPGIYTVQVTVTDTYGVTATATKTITVNELNITGAVSHTPEWEINRQKYNNAAIEAGRSTRSPDTYFAGEKYMLTGTTTAIDPASHVTVQNVTVQIVGKGFSTTLIQTGHDVFTGSLWHESMLRWTDGIVDFCFEVTYSNGTRKSDTVRTYIVDDEYWRLHRLF